jgi:hypothetical protein
MVFIDWFLISSSVTERQSIGKRIHQNWEPEPGDDLVGIVTDALVVEGTRWGYVVVAVMTDIRDVMWGVWLSRTVLKRLFEEKRPQIGALISIVYLGPETSGSTGYTYHNYMMGGGPSIDVTGREWAEDAIDEARKVRHRS